MALSDHVSLTITADSVGVTRPGFGTPLILSHSASFAERTRSYTDLAGIAADGFATDSPEYLAAAAMFAQTPRPEKVKIGRAALPPTLAYSISVATVRNSHTYRLNVKGEGVTATEVSFTSDANATDGEIIIGLVAALEAVVGKNYTATGTTSPADVTADAAGNWFSIESPDLSDLTVVMDHADPGVATDLAAINVEDSDWYGLYTMFNSNAYGLAAAGWAESNKKLYVCESCDSATVTTAATNGDLIDDLKTQNYARTLGAFHPDPSEFFGAAWMGRMLPLEPGAATWKFKTLAGISSVSLTSTQRGNLVAKNGNSMETSGGVVHTFEGTTGNGDFADNQRGDDWLEAEMRATVFEALANAQKVPFTDKGVVVIESAVAAALKRASRRGIITENYTVTVPAVADVSTANKTSRTLPDVKFQATRAGAIHKVLITGVVSV